MTINDFSTIVKDKWKQSSKWWEKHPLSSIEYIVKFTSPKKEQGKDKRTGKNKIISRKY